MRTDKRFVDGHSGGGAQGVGFVWTAFGLATLAAALVFFYVEPVPTMAIPPILSALPLVWSRGRIAALVRLGSAVALLLFCLLGVMSVGALFLPATASMALGAARAASANGSRPAA